MKKKRNLFIIIGSIILSLIIATVIFFVLRGNNKLTVQERTWINNNISTIQNINIVNNSNVFGKNASGVFYDFLKDFSLEYGMQINPITFTSNNVPSGISLGVKNSINESDVVFYTDHYVVISPKDEVISEYRFLKDKTIGITSTNASYVASYVGNATTLNTYENDTLLYEALGTEIDYAIVPLMQSLDLILSNNYNILYHLSDVNCYYVMQTTNDILSSVLKKYYQKWEDNLNEYFLDHEFELFTESLNISESEIDRLQSVVLVAFI